MRDEMTMKADRRLTISRRRLIAAIRAARGLGCISEREAAQSLERVMAGQPVDVIHEEEESDVGIHHRMHP